MAALGSITARFRTCAALSLITAVSVSVFPASAAPMRPHGVPDARAAFAKLPLSFELNKGQADAGVKFLSHGPGYGVFLTPKQVTIAITRSMTEPVLGIAGQKQQRANHASYRSNLQMTLRGAADTPPVVGTEELVGKANYFIGNDPKAWLRNVPTYSKVRYRGVYPGVDLVFYGNNSGQLEYDFILAPGSNVRAIEVVLQAQVNEESTTRTLSVTIDPGGDLVMHDGAGDVRLRKPIVYQEDEAGHKEYRDGRYLLDSKNGAAISFDVGDYDHSRPLVIDPAIVYSTLLSGTNGELPGSTSGIDVFTDSSAGKTYAYVTGSTCDSDFPIVGAEQSLYAGGCNSQPVWGGDTFVTKFDTSSSGSASVVFSTYLGGSGLDTAYAMAVDASGNALVTGLTQSTNFPVLNAYQSTLPSKISGPNAFLTKLSADGSTLLYSTYFGGSSLDGSSAIALDSSGNAYVAGYSYSPDLPTVNPYQGTLTGKEAAFVAEFDTTQAGLGSLLYSTYLGGANSGAVFGDRANAIAIDPLGTVHVAGQASSNQFPVVNAYQGTPNYGFQPSSLFGAAFYARLNPSATGAAQLLYSTYLGGSIGPNGEQIDGVYAIAVDPVGKAYLTGDDVSAAFPTTSVADQSNPEYTFVAKIDPSLGGTASLVYSTVFRTGGPWFQGILGTKGIAVDASGNAFVVGSSLPGLPLVNAISGSANGVLQSTTGGQTWAVQNQGLTDFPIFALAIDASTSPRTMYAGTGRGTVFATKDGGITWGQVLQVASTDSPTCSRVEPPQDVLGISTVCVMALAVDLTSADVYAGTTSGVYKSSDRGLTWNTFNVGLSSTAAQGILALQFDGGTLYAGAADGLYSLSPGASSWVISTLTSDVRSIAFDTNTTPHTILTGSDISGAYRSADGGLSWSAINSDDGFISALGVDTRPNPSELYGVGSAGYYYSGYLTVWKSVDEGNTWNALNTPTLRRWTVASVAADLTTTPSTVYVADPGTILSSSDGGNTWTDRQPSLPAAGLGFLPTIGTMAIDSSTTPSTVYTTTGIPFPNAFVLELDPTGTAVLFSSYLGGLNANTWATAVALDASANIYVTGVTTYPLYFPQVNAFQTATATNGRSSFVTVLDIRQTTTINVSNIPGNAVYGGTFTPAYVYTGDGATSVTSSTSSTCATTAGVVSYVGVGVCTLTAHATAGNNYASVDGSPQSFTIVQATPTIIINDIPISAVFGRGFTPTYSYGGDGNPSVATSTASTCAVSDSFVTFSGTGTCTLTAHATATTNYTAATGSLQSFNISQAVPSVGISNIPPNAQYGGSFVPAYAYAGDGITSVSSGTTPICSVSGSAVNFVGIGTCSLTAHATATANSKAATGSAQSFTIAQATPTIAISNIPTNAVYNGSFMPTYAYGGSGKTSTTSSTVSICTVSGKGTVSFIGAGTCTLTSHATATTNYAAANGSPQSFALSKATTTISIKNVPNSAKKGGSFTPTYNYIGDGAQSVTSNTPGICATSGTVVNFVASGTCTLASQATSGANYLASTGSPQSFTVK